jgi:hypothetical protein
MSELSQVNQAALESYTQRMLATVGVLDPEILEDDETRFVVELGAIFGFKITEEFGTPDQPRWTSGVYAREAFMARHNGGDDGHTSVGERGAGVPRNVLLIAQAVNQHAGEVVYDPHQRALAFYAAMAQDLHQLEGRALYPNEVNDFAYSNEGLSVRAATSRYIRAMTDHTVDDVDQARVLRETRADANRIQEYIKATAMNSIIGVQAVHYTGLRYQPLNMSLWDSVLGQELVACADLLAANTRRGPLSAIEAAVEELGMPSGEHKLQMLLYEQDVEYWNIDTMAGLLVAMQDNIYLRDAFIAQLQRQAEYVASGLEYCDETIEEVCGKRMDHLFGHREENARILSGYALELYKDDTISVLSVWHRARELAGYTE